MEKEVRKDTDVEEHLPPHDTTLLVTPRDETSPTKPSSSPPEQLSFTDELPSVAAQAAMYTSDLYKELYERELQNKEVDYIEDTELQTVQEEDEFERETGGIDNAAFEETEEPDDAVYQPGDMAREPPISLYDRGRTYSEVATEEVEQDVYDIQEIQEMQEAQEAEENAIGCLTKEEHREAFVYEDSEIHIETRSSEETVRAEEYDRKIKGGIFEEECTLQPDEASSPEEKILDTGDAIEKHIKLGIFAAEISQAIGTSSPERKTFDDYKKEYLAQEPVIKDGTKELLRDEVIDGKQQPFISESEPLKPDREFVQEIVSPIEDKYTSLPESEVPVSDRDSPAADEKLSDVYKESPVPISEALVPDTELSGAEEETTVMKRESPVVEIKLPVSEEETMLIETKLPVAERELPYKDEESKVPDTEAPITEKEHRVKSDSSVAAPVPVTDSVTETLETAKEQELDEKNKRTKVQNELQESEASISSESEKSVGKSESETDSLGGVDESQFVYEAEESAIIIGCRDVSESTKYLKEQEISEHDDLYKKIEEDNENEQQCAHEEAQKYDEESKERLDVSEYKQSESKITVTKLPLGQLLLESEVHVKEMMEIDQVSEDHQYQEIAEEEMLKLESAKETDEEETYRADDEEEKKEELVEKLMKAKREESTDSEGLPTTSTDMSEDMKSPEFAGDQSLTYDTLADYSKKDKIAIVDHHVPEEHSPEQMHEEIEHLVWEVGVQEEKQTVETADEIRTTMKKIGYLTHEQDILRETYDESKQPLVRTYPPESPLDLDITGSRSSTPISSESEGVLAVALPTPLSSTEDPSKDVDLQEAMSQSSSLGDREFDRSEPLDRLSPSSFDSDMDQFESITTILKDVALNEALSRSSSVAEPKEPDEIKEVDSPCSFSDERIAKEAVITPAEEFKQRHMSTGSISDEELKARPAAMHEEFWKTFDSSTLCHEQSQEPTLLAADQKQNTEDILDVSSSPDNLANLDTDEMEQTEQISESYHETIIGEKWGATYIHTEHKAYDVEDEADTEVQNTVEEVKQVDEEKPISKSKDIDIEQTYIVEEEHLSATTKEVSEKHQMPQEEDEKKHDTDQDKLHFKDHDIEIDDHTTSTVVDESTDSEIPETDNEYPLKSEKKVVEPYDRPVEFKMGDEFGHVMFELGEHSGERRESDQGYDVMASYTSYEKQYTHTEEFSQSSELRFSQTSSGTHYETAESGKDSSSEAYMTAESGPSSRLTSPPEISSYETAQESLTAVESYHTPASHDSSVESTHSSRQSTISFESYQPSECADDATLMASEEETEDHVAETPTFEKEKFLIPETDQSMEASTDTAIMGSSFSSSVMKESFESEQTFMPSAHDSTIDSDIKEVEKEEEMLSEKTDEQAPDDRSESPFEFISDSEALDMPEDDSVGAGTVALGIGAVIATASISSALAYDASQSQTGPVEINVQTYFAADVQDQELLDSNGPTEVEHVPDPGPGLDVDSPLEPQEPVIYQPQDEEIFESPDEEKSHEAAPETMSSPEEEIKIAIAEEDLDVSEKIDEEGEEEVQEDEIEEDHDEQDKDVQDTQLNGKLDHVHELCTGPQVESIEFQRPEEQARSVSFEDDAKRPQTSSSSDDELEIPQIQEEQILFEGDGTEEQKIETSKELRDESAGVALYFEHSTDPEYLSQPESEQVDSRPDSGFHLDSRPDSELRLSSQVSEDERELKELDTQDDIEKVLDIIERPESPVPREEYEILGEEEPEEEKMDRSKDEGADDEREEPYDIMADSLEESNLKQLEESSTDSPDSTIKPPPQDPMQMSLDPEAFGQLGMYGSKTEEQIKVEEDWHITEECESQQDLDDIMKDSLDEEKFRQTEYEKEDVMQDSLDDHHFREHFETRKEENVMEDSLEEDKFKQQSIFRIKQESEDLMQDSLDEDYFRHMEAHTEGQEAQAEFSATHEDIMQDSLDEDKLRKDTQALYQGSRVADYTSQAMEEEHMRKEEDGVIKQESREEQEQYEGRKEEEAEYFQHKQTGPEGTKLVESSVKEKESFVASYAHETTTKTTQSDTPDITVTHITKYSESDDSKCSSEDKTLDFDEKSEVLEADDIVEDSKDQKEYMGKKVVLIPEVTEDLFSHETDLEKKEKDSENAFEIVEKVESGYGDARDDKLDIVEKQDTEASVDSDQDVVKSESKPDTDKSLSSSRHSSPGVKADSQESFFPPEDETRRSEQSLEEFERLEKAIIMEDRRQHISTDSSSPPHSAGYNNKKSFPFTDLKKNDNESGSVSSLTEFERLEREILEEEEKERMDTIVEGQPLQSTPKEFSSGSSAGDPRIEDIEEIVRQASENVEEFTRGDLVEEKPHVSDDDKEVEDISLQDSGLEKDTSQRFSMIQSTDSTLVSSVISSSMISSTDTIEQDKYHLPFQPSDLTTVIDSEGMQQEEFSDDCHVEYHETTTTTDDGDSETILTTTYKVYDPQTGDLAGERTIMRRTVQKISTEPLVQQFTYTAPVSDRELVEKSVPHFEMEPGDEVEEQESVDEKGNVTKTITRRRVTTKTYTEPYQPGSHMYHTQRLSSSSGSGNSIFMRIEDTEGRLKPTRILQHRQEHDSPYMTTYSSSYGDTQTRETYRRSRQSPTPSETSTHSDTCYCGPESPTIRLSRTQHDVPSGINMLAWSL